MRCTQFWKKFCGSFFFASNYARLVSTMYVKYQDNLTLTLNPKMSDRHVILAVIARKKYKVFVSLFVLKLPYFL